MHLDHIIAFFAHLTVARYGDVSMSHRFDAVDDTYRICYDTAPACAASIDRVNL